MDFAVPTDYRAKLKECEKRNEYRDLAWELKKLWNMKVTIIPTVTSSLGTVTKGLVQRLEHLGMTALLKSPRILRRVLET